MATTLASDHVLAVLYKPYVFPDAPTQTEEAPARPPVGLLDVDPDGGARSDCMGCIAFVTSLVFPHEVRGKFSKKQARQSTEVSRLKSLKNRLLLAG